MKSEKLKVEVDEFESIGFAKNSTVHKDTTQAINAEIDNATTETEDKLSQLQQSEKALIKKANTVKQGLKNDTANELAKIDIELQLSQLDPFENTLHELTEKHKNTVYNLTDSSQMKAAKSDSMEFSRACSALEKKYTEIAGPINEVRKKLLDKRGYIRDSLRTGQSRIKDQITAHETAILEHLEMLDNKIQHIEDCANFEGITLISDNIKKRIDYVESLNIDESYEHCQETGIELKTKILTILQNLFDETLQAEKDAKELEELRAFKAEHDKKEHDKKIAEQAIENARIKAEQQPETFERPQVKLEQEIDTAAMARKSTDPRKHRYNIHCSVRDSLIRFGLDRQRAGFLVQEIIDNKITNLSINY